MVKEKLGGTLVISTRLIILFALELNYSLPHVTYSLNLQVFPSNRTRFAPLLNYENIKSLTAIILVTGNF